MNRGQRLGLLWILIGLFGMQNTLIIEAGVNWIMVGFFAVGTLLFYISD